MRNDEIVSIFFFALCSYKKAKFHGKNAKIARNFPHFWGEITYFLFHEIFAIFLETFRKLSLIYFVFS